MATKLYKNIFVAIKSEFRVSKMDVVKEEELLEVIKGKNTTNDWCGELFDGISNIVTSDLLLLASCQGVEHGAETYLIN